MSGGGDTPSKKTFRFKPESQGTQYVFGTYDDTVVKIEGPTTSSVYMANNEGVIVLLLDMEEEGFEYLKNGLTPLLGEISEIKAVVTTGLAVGDDVPNWESYEQLN